MKARAKELGATRIRVNSAGCLDRCEEGPCLVVYPKGIWYRITSPDDVERVLKEYLLGESRPIDLMMAGRLADAE